MSAASALASITGLGAISSLGAGTDPLWEAALNGGSSLREGFGLIPQDIRASGLTSPDFSTLVHRLEESPALSLSLRAAWQAFQQAGWSSLNPEDGLIIGTTTGQANYWEPSLMSFLKNPENSEESVNRYAGSPLGTLASDLQEIFKHHGPAQTIASACCASTQAIAIASHWISTGRVKRCLVGGVELLCDLTRTGFQSLQILSKERCRPFDKDRSGINLSEAVVFLCLEKGGAENRLAQVSGFGIAGDASHMTAPHPDGDGCRRAMLGALAMAKLSPSEIDWIHAHGTGSRHNDLAESKAILGVFPSLPPVSSTKAVHGHALGASGALESVLVCRSLREGRLLPNWGIENQDPEIFLSIPREPKEAKLRHVMKNTLAFGGVNTSLVFSA